MKINTIIISMTATLIIGCGTKESSSLSSDSPGWGTRPQDEKGCMAAAQHKAGDLFTVSSSRKVDFGTRNVTSGPDALYTDKVYKEYRFYADEASFAAGKQEASSSQGTTFEFESIKTDTVVNMICAEHSAGSDSTSTSTSPSYTNQSSKSEQEDGLGWGTLPKDEEGCMAAAQHKAGDAFTVNRLRRVDFGTRKVDAGPGGTNSGVYKEYRFYADEASFAAGKRKANSSADSLSSFQSIKTDKEINVICAEYAISNASYVGSDVNQ